MTRGMIDLSRDLPTRRVTFPLSRRHGHASASRKESERNHRYFPATTDVRLCVIRHVSLTVAAVAWRRQNQSQMTIQFAKAADAARLIACAIDPAIERPVCCDVEFRLKDVDDDQAKAR